MRGFADLHCHPMSHLGFGRRLFWGAPDGGPIEAVLRTCEEAHGAGGTGIFVGNPALTRFEDPGFGGAIGHMTGGARNFDGWPRFTTLIHQQMWVDWIRRSFDGGLRLMVALAVNNEFLARELGGVAPYDDVTVVEAQLRAMSAFASRHQEWMAVALSPQEARAIIEGGRLAVVLGVEVDSLGNWRRESDCSDDDVRRYLQHLHDDLGVRHLFTVHLADNAFAGAAVYDDRFALLNRALNDDYIQVEDASADGIEFRLEVDPGLAVDWYKSPVNFTDPFGGAYYRPPESYRTTAGGHANRRGLTARGRTLIAEMMRLGMVIDVDHMSKRALHETLDMAEAARYPVVSGHTGFRELRWHWQADGRGETASVHKCGNESQKSAADIERIARLGGIVAPVLSQGDVRAAAEADPSLPARVPNDCAGSATSWAQAYLYAVRKMGGRGVAMGTDGNGLNKLPGPRFGPNAAYDLDNGVIRDERRRPNRAAQVAAQRDGVRYDSAARDWRRYRWAEGATTEHLDSDRQRDMWVAVGVVRSGCDPWSNRTPTGETIEGLNGRVRNLARGLTATRDQQLERPNFLGLGTGNAPWEQRAGFLVKSGQVPGNSDRDPPPVHEIHAELRPIWERAQAMDGPNTPISRSLAGRRDFDVNIDGVAHYGMLPDFVQDLRNLGLTDDDLAPLFRSAEDYIELWQRCRSGPETVAAEPLRVVKVDATAIAQLFWASDSIGVEDTTSPLELNGAGGAGFVQSRTYPPGTTSETNGLRVYEYRVALDGVTGDGRIESLTLELGAVETVEYRAGEPGEVFVTSQGGIGSVGLVAVERAGADVTFSFDDGGVEAGASSFFFAVSSLRPARPAVAVLVDGAGDRYEVAVVIPES